MSEIPDALRRTHPELASIETALEQLARGEAITARCIHCSELLRGARVDAIGSVWISCPCRKTTFHAQGRAR